MISSPPPILTCTLDSLAATARFGLILGSECKPGDIICLGGELGAGKTTLAQALALGIGIDKAERVNSPTFALVHEYQGEVIIYHMDFYRLGSDDDVVELGLDEYFYTDGIAMIELLCKKLPTKVKPNDTMTTLFLL
ncbi:MAG: tRNA (adenosine(37)-N6)-threonylcarbamoyltransferase complex ATPase subunit type 1 TsaE [Desulfofustis sp.]